MRKRFVAAFLATVFLITLPTTDLSSAGDPNLLLYEIIPIGDFEGVTLYNYGTGTAVLSDYSISDGEGAISFEKNIMIRPDEKITLLKSEPPKWLNHEHYVIIGTEGTSSKKFTLNNSGDDVHLMRGETLVDTFVYGKVTTEKGWSGESFQNIGEYSYVKRDSVIDTDTLRDWSIIYPGRTDLPAVTEGFSATVTPFVFPDSSGDPVIDALEKAENEVLISIYIMHHPKIMSLLTFLNQKGVSVTVFAEGSPVGGVPENEVQFFSAMDKKGIDIRFLISEDGFKRYDYLHNKYAIIDSDTVIVTSENWIESSFENNRGWGAVIESIGFAEYMKGVFIDDSSLENEDVVSFRERYPTATSCNIPTYKDDTADDYVKYEATVIPVLSPDNSFESLKRLMSDSQKRIFSQQLSVEYQWASKTDNPISWMIDAGKKGVDSRLMMDVSFDDPNDLNVHDGYGVSTALEDIDWIDVKTIKGTVDFSLTHNKGVIIDDITWLGSVNWTDNSFLNNRECAIIICSESVTSVFAETFNSDWGVFFSGEISLQLTTSTDDFKEKVPFILDSSGSVVPTGAVFEWDLNEDGVVDRLGQRIPVEFDQGIHNVLLLVTDPDGGVYRKTISIDVSGQDTIEQLPSYVKYIPLLFLSAIVLVMRCIKCKGRDETVHKGIRTGGRKRSS